MEEKISTPFGMLMPGRGGRSGSGGWVSSTGTGSLPASPSYDSPRTTSSPSEYKATVSIEFLPGFESREVDAFEAYITTDDGSGGTGTGDQGYASGGYRYGFNGKENDDETGTQDYGLRIYDPRLGRFLSMDPLDEEYPYYSPYHFAGNTPIQAIDLDGAEPAYSYVENGRRVYMPAGDNLPRHVPAEHAQFIPRVVSTGGGGAGTSLILDFTPVVGQTKAIGELFTGEDYITKRPLSWGERLWGLVPYLGKFARGTKVAKALYVSKKVSDVEVEVIKTTARANGAKNKVEKNLQAAEEKAVVTQRPSTFRKKTVKDAWDNAQDGSVPNTKSCPDCKKDVEGNPQLNEKRSGKNGWDVDHQPKWKDRNLDGKSRKEVIDEYNKDVRLRCKNCNRSDNQ